jgi:SEC-C motif-containing protein
MMNLVQASIDESGPETPLPTRCPCCSGLPFAECCQPILNGTPAQTAEALVRSRYCAFAVKRLDHVESTHASEIRDDFNRAEAERLADECVWDSLRIHKATEAGDTAEVEYVMQVRRDGNCITKAIKSTFRRENGQWYYVSAKPAAQLEQVRSTKINRNDPCTCGSGKKYKKCCGMAA